MEITLIPKPSYAVTLHRDSKAQEKKRKRAALKKRATSLTVSAAVLVAVISALYPMYPLAIYAIQDTAGVASSLGTLEQYPQATANNAPTQNSANTGAAAPGAEHASQDNRIIIPKINVDMPITEAPVSEARSAWDKGAWRDPRTSTPAGGGNTVVSAHRFRYRPPHTKTFYLLDKLKAGDRFTILWQGQEYHYEVQGQKVVPPTAVDILSQTDTPTVTLFTCTPLFSTENRLVVRASLLNVE